MFLLAFAMSLLDIAKLEMLMFIGLEFPHRIRSGESPCLGRVSGITENSRLAQSSLQRSPLFFCCLRQAPWIDPSGLARIPCAVDSGAQVGHAKRMLGPENRPALFSKFCELEARATREKSGGMRDRR